MKDHIKMQEDPDFFFFWDEVQIIDKQHYSKNENPSLNVAIVTNGFSATPLKE